MNELGDYLLKQRKSKKLSIRGLDKLSGVSHTYLISLEKGIDPRTGQKRIPTPDTLRKLSKALNVKYVDLLLLSGILTKEDVLEFLYISRRRGDEW